MRNHGQEDKRTIYVFTTLIKASENSDRIARTAGCGSWHGETALEPVLDKKGCVIGNKRMLCFQITDESLKECHWIMHEYSLPDGNATNGKGEYVLCRIKRDDSKDTKISPRKQKNAEGATTDDDLSVPKPSKRVEQSLCKSRRWNVIVLRHWNQKLFLSQKNQRSNKNFVLDHDYDDFGNILLPTEVDPPILALAPSVPVPIETFEDYGQQYLNPSHISAQNLPNAENLCSGDQESDLFLTPITRFQATTEPWPTCSISSNMHGQQDPETLWQLMNMSWQENNIPQRAGEIDLLWNEVWD
ncbi:hypothetical protein RHSIM_Rhsim04G0194300 [Rhododendron simsii]|uniref:NAC domain-containing protein n=1 Tax=Rhododendron simsii TaxID=118357 RepID=A0A834LRB0_RHOSS|nr:hypothetical protein RHSIM_Rhsim04G0194300 [Rhododendron simsii]